MADLMTTELTLTGRLTTASNATFLGNIGENVVVYKPIAGENPLWDFPEGQLAHREVAAYLVSEALGWNIVPRTWLRSRPPLKIACVSPANSAPVIASVRPPIEVALVLMFPWIASAG